MDIIVQQSSIDFNVETIRGETLAQAALEGALEEGDVKCVETLAALETFDCWNVPGTEVVDDSDGDPPIMWALHNRQTEIVDILLRCPRVDLSIRDRIDGGWSLVFRAIQRNKLGEKMSKCLVQKIL